MNIKSENFLPADGLLKPELEREARKTSPDLWKANTITLFPPTLPIYNFFFLTRHATHSSINIFTASRREEECIIGEGAGGIPKRFLSSYN